MDFLKDIVNEIGGDFTQIASEIEEDEVFVDTGSFIFNALVSGSIYGVYLVTKLLQLLGKVLLERLSSHSQWSRTSWILIPMHIAFILILKQQSIKAFWSQEVLILNDWLSSMSLQ